MEHDQSYFKSVPTINTLRRKYSEDFIFHYDKIVNADKYYVNRIDENAPVFMQTANDEPNYLIEDLEPELESDSDSEDDENLEPTCIAFDSTQIQSQSPSPTESQAVEQLLPARKSLLDDEIKRYRNLSNDVFLSCKSRSGTGHIDETGYEGLVHKNSDWSETII